MFQTFLAGITVTCGEIGNCPGKTKTIDQGITNIAQILIGVIGGVAIIIILISALRMIVSHGDPVNYQRGRQGVIYAVIGLTLTIVAYAIVGLVAQLGQ